MASGTITGTTSNQYIDCKIVWSSTANTSSNQSSVVAALYYKRNNTGFHTSGSGTFTIKIGSHTATITKSLTITNADWVEAIKTSCTVDHNTDGTKTITISATGSISGTTLTSTSCSKAVSLDTIPRATTIDYLTYGSSQYFDTTFTYKYTPKNSAYYNRCTISLKTGESTNYTITTINLGKKSTSQQTATVKFTESQLDSIYRKLTNTKEGTLNFTISTYSDSNYSKIVGDATSKKVTVKIPSNTDTQPSMSKTISPQHSLSDKFKNIYVQGKSKVKVTLSAEGKCGADIKSVTVSVGGKLCTKSGDDYLSSVLSTSGKVEVRIEVKDTRDMKLVYVGSCTVIPYSKPSILPLSGESSIICARCDDKGYLSDTGTSLRLKARRSYSKVESDDVQNNFCAIRYRYKEEDDTDFGAWKTVLAKTTTTTDTIDTALSGVLPSTTISYVLQVGVVDDVGESDAVQFIIPTTFTTIDIPEVHNGRRIGLFRYAEGTPEDGLYMGLPIFGGSIDSLKKGTPLTATATTPLDLNDTKTPGCYYSPGEDYSKYIVNSPYNKGGFGLEVREIQSANYIRQTLYYGRTTWVRHWNTTEWSAWIRIMTTASDDTVADFVIESGTYATDYGTWTYKKWLGGTYQMFGKFTVTPTESTQHTSVYRTNSIGIPAPFDITSAVVSGTPMGYYWISNGGISDDHKNVAFRLISDEAFTTTTAIDVRLSVVGNYE